MRRAIVSSSLGRCRLTEAMLLLLVASVAVAGDDMVLFTDFVADIMLFMFDLEVLLIL